MMESERWEANKGVNCAFEASKQKCKCPEHGKQRDGAKAWETDNGVPLVTKTLGAPVTFSEKMPLFKASAMPYNH